MAGDPDLETTDAIIRRARRGRCGRHRAGPALQRSACGRSYDRRGRRARARERHAAGGRSALGTAARGECAAAPLHLFQSRLPVRNWSVRAASQSGRPRRRHRPRLFARRIARSADGIAAPRIGDAVARRAIDKTRACNPNRRSFKRLYLRGFASWRDGCRPEPRLHTPAHAARDAAGVDRKTACSRIWSAPRGGRRGDRVADRRLRRRQRAHRFVCRDSG